MATKNNPGKFDCYENADPDEPMFVLLGRDPTAPILVDLWVKIRRELACTEPEKLAEAEACALALTRWAQKLGKEEKVIRAREAASNVMIRMMKKAIEG